MNAWITNKNKYLEFGNVKDLSRLGDYDNLILEITGSEMEISVPKSSLSDQTLMSAGDNAGAAKEPMPEALWFGTTTIHMTNVETVTTAMTYSQIESPATDMTLATSLGTSPPDTSSSSDTDDANDATTSVPAGIALSSTHLMQTINSQVVRSSQLVHFSIHL